MQVPCHDYAALCWIEAHPGLAGYIQAVGAIVAIAVSIQLARGSAKREREAEQAAIQRERAADEAAARRMEQADRAASERIRLASFSQHNAIVEQISSLGKLAVEQCRMTIEKVIADNNASRATFIGGLGSSRLTDLREALPALRERTGDAQLLDGIARLSDASMQGQVQAQGIGAYASALRAQLNAVEDALHLIEAQRRS